MPVNSKPDCLNGEKPNKGTAHVPGEGLVQNSDHSKMMPPIHLNSQTSKTDRTEWGVGWANSYNFICHLYTIESSNSLPWDSLRKNEDGSLCKA